MQNWPVIRLLEEIADVLVADHHRRHAARLHVPLDAFSLVKCHIYVCWACGLPTRRTEALVRRKSAALSTSIFCSVSDSRCNLRLQCLSLAVNIVILPHQWCRLRLVLTDMRATHTKRHIGGGPGTAGGWSALPIPCKLIQVPLRLLLRSNRARANQFSDLLLSVTGCVNSYGSHFTIIEGQILLL